MSKYTLAEGEFSDSVVVLNPVSEQVRRSKVGPSDPTSVVAALVLRNSTNQERLATRLLSTDTSS